MFQQTIALIGLPINHSNMQDFLVEHGYKLPKKTEISGRNSERDFWIEHKKLGVNLLFSIDIKNFTYAPVAAEKKGLWMPVLQYVTFLNAKIEYPLGLKMGLSHDQTAQILGTPSYKSSDISKSWLNDDGSESFYGWNYSLDQDKQIELHARIHLGGELDEINVRIATLDSVFYLYDVLRNERIEHLLADSFSSHQVAMFVEWAIKNALYVGESQHQAIIAQVKNGVANGLDFLSKHINSGHIFTQQFTPTAQQFVRQYGNNMSSFDILYSRDYSLSFLTNTKQRNNYMGEAAIETLRQMAYSIDNKAKIFSLLDKRLAEFNEHGFAKSKVEIQ